MAEQNPQDNRSSFRGATTESAANLQPPPPGGAGQIAAAESAAQADAAKQEEKRIEQAEERAPSEQVPPPVTAGNHHLVMGSAASEAVNERSNFERENPQRSRALTADEMIRVNEVKVGTFTDAEIESASLAAYDPAEKPLNPPGVPSVTGGMAGERAFDETRGRGGDRGPRSAEPSVHTETSDAGQVERLQERAREQDKGSEGGQSSIAASGEAEKREAERIDRERRPE